MDAKADIHHTRRVLDRTCEGYISRLFPTDKGDVIRFVNDLQAQGYSPSRVIKYLSGLVSIKKILDKPFSEASVEDAKRYVAWLEKSDYSDWRKYDLKIILRVYMRYIGKAEAVDWMLIKQPRNGTMPEEILIEEDIGAVAGAAYTTRDRAFVLSLYESGARIGEFLPLKIKHLRFDKHGAILRVTGKTGDRRIRLVASVLALQRWLEEHPGKDDPEAYLWCQIPGPYHPADKVKYRHLSYGFICKLLRELAAKVGVKKKVNPHAFRHARATFMARHLKEPEMREFFGWGRDSKMPSIYVHLSGRDVDNSVLGIYGIKEAKESQEPVLKVQSCPRCRELNDPASRFCGKCGLPLDQPYADNRLEELVVELLKIVAEENPQIKKKFRKLVKEKNAMKLFS
jgi:integrase/ribosomal protein S27AE